MKYLKYLLYLVLGLVAVVLIVGLVAPKDYLVEREILVNKPKDFVFAQVKKLENHERWNPWAMKDPQIHRNYRGTDGTVGFLVAWSGNKDVGKGEQEITAITEGERVDQVLRFKEPFEDTANVYWITENAGENQTKVRWGMTGTRKYPLNAITYIFRMDKMFERDFDTGLNMLKTELEK